MKHSLCVLALALAAAHVHGHAAEVPRLPVATFFKNADIGSATLSPNGRYLATTARKNDNLQLAVLDLETGEAKVLSGYTESDIANVMWIDNDRLAYSIIDRSYPNNFAAGLFTVARTSGKPVMVIGTHPGYSLTDTDIFAVRPVARSHKDPRKMLAVGYIANGADAQPATRARQGVSESCQRDPAGRGRRAAPDRVVLVDRSWPLSALRTGQQEGQLPVRRTPVDRSGADGRAGGIRLQGARRPADHGLSDHTEGQQRKRAAADRDAARRAARARYLGLRAGRAVPGQSRLCGAAAAIPRLDRLRQGTLQEGLPPVGPGDAGRSQRRRAPWSSRAWPIPSASVSWGPATAAMRP